MKTISYGRQSLNESDTDSVVRVLESDFLTQGPRVGLFEEALAAYCGAKFAVVTSSGTAALHIASLAAGLGPGKAALTVPNTFLATPNSVIYTGATPYFTDIDPDTRNISLEAVQQTIEDLYTEGVRPKVILPVHFAGLPVDMELLREISDCHGLKVIEDACHALGAEYLDAEGTWHRVGDCAFSDMSVFSFHPLKSITTGEGGAVTTNDPALYESLKRLVSHGVDKGGPFTNMDPSLGAAQPWYHEMTELGFNYRMTDIQAALGLNQLKRLDDFVDKRRRLAALYDDLFESIPEIKGPPRMDGFKSSHHLYVIEIDFEALSIDKGLWFREMADKGIGLQVHYIPVHLQPYYRKRYATAPGDFPASEAYYRRAVTLPLYPDLSEEDLRYVAETVAASLVK